MDEMRLACYCCTTNYSISFLASLAQLERTLHFPTICCFALYVLQLIKGYLLLQHILSLFFYLFVKVFLFLGFLSLKWWASHLFLLHDEESTQSVILSLFRVCVCLLSRGHLRLFYLLIYLRSISTWRSAAGAHSQTGLNIWPNI